MTINLRNAIESFFEEFQFPDNSRNTKRTYKTALSNFLFYAEKMNVDKKPVSDLDSSIVSLYGSWLIHQGMSEPTQKIYESALPRAINYWRIKGWIDFTSDEEKQVRVAMRIQSRKSDLAVSSRVGRVPEDFGDRMLSIAREQLAKAPSTRLGQLIALRSLALIHLLRATGLRIGDACRLTRSDLRSAGTRDGYFTVQMQKTGSFAHCFLGPAATRAIESYLETRADSSPWIFIQHGRAAKTRSGTTQFFRTARKGYGAKISTKTAWEIIRKAGVLAYGNTSMYISPHAFRHWHAQSLIRAGARLEDVQSVLGHANPVITKQIYAPEPDISRISEKEKIVQDGGRETSTKTRKIGREEKGVADGD
jgi:site-specific recombinase XerD